ncbi:MAG: rRNA pseudouridine synthase [Deltaproteobacteria bacterium]|nr:rRNA pseudouridine synthase [Deltaproteobacteria bacterium]
MEGERLQKVVARAGVTSRRDAERMIVEGRIRLNGKVVKELGVRVQPTDRIEVDGERLGSREPKVTVLLFKPAGVMTTMKDPEGRRTVRELVADIPVRLVPVGRLDYATEGLLLLTTDGELGRRLTHPSFEVPKTYAVKVGGHPSRAALELLRRGVRLEEDMTGPALVDVLEEADRHTWIELIIREGKNRQVRRMCEAIGHEARRVVRTSIGAIDIGIMRPGQYVILDGQDLAGLYRMVELEGVEPPPELDEKLGRLLGKAERGRGPIPGAGIEAVVPPKEPEHERRRSRPRRSSAR